MVAFNTAALFAALLSFAISSFSISHSGPAATGGVEGRVTVRQLPVRVANRYAGTGTATRAVESLPAIAFIEGSIMGAPPVMANAAEMAQQDTSFSPGFVVLPVGATLRFPNHDKFFHNVFSYSKTKRFDLGRYPKGEAKTVTFDKPGTVAVFCEIHKWMRGAVLVLDNPYYATVREDGTFTIPDVPPGHYTLSIWHAERGKKSFDVVVPSSGMAHVNATL